MGQVEFLHALFETGQVKVGPLAGSPGADRIAAGAGQAVAGAPSATLEVVRAWDEANRLEFPGRAPPLVEAVAVRAAECFYRACQFTVYRDVDAPTVAELFAEPVHVAGERRAGEQRASSDPKPTAPHHYTVDLIFRFLPELYRLADRASSADPLCDGLRLWAAEWPLSSIGMSAIGDRFSSSPALPNSPSVAESREAAKRAAGEKEHERVDRSAHVNPFDLDAVCNDAGLLRLYADRVIARRDESRLADPRVRAAVRAALGHFDQLAGPLAKALQSFAPPSAPEPTQI